MISATAELVSLLRRPIADADRDRARWHILDWYGCACHGATEAAGRRWAMALCGAGGVHWSVAGPCHSGEAALQMNAAVGNLGEMDDVHRRSVLHPGPVVIPVALALGQDLGADLGAICDAVIRGYESTIRVGEALGPAHYRYFHSTATAGVFGATAAAASLMGLDDRAWCWAFGNAGSVAGGLWQLRNESTDTKQWHNANAARVGVQAARLAAAGISGPLQILEGPQGLLNATSDGGDPARVSAESQAPWRLHDCSFKPWPACRHAHPVIDAALQLRERVDLSSLQTVTLEVYDDARVFCDRHDPATALDARFSLQYCAAVALLDGPPTLDDFAPDAWYRPAHRALMEKVRVEPSAALTAVYPERFGAVIVAHDASGRHVSAVDDTLGDPARPLDSDALQAKLAMLLGVAEPGAIRGRLDRWLALALAAPASVAVATLDALRR